MPTAVQRDADIFQCVTHTRSQITRPEYVIHPYGTWQRARQSHSKARAGLVIYIIGTVKIPLMAIDIHIQGDLPVEEPGLHELRLVVLLLSPQLDKQPEPFPAAGEVWRMKQVKI